MAVTCRANASAPSSGCYDLWLFLATWPWKDHNFVNASSKSFLLVCTQTVNLEDAQAPNKAGQFVWGYREIPRSYFSTQPPGLGASTHAPLYFHLSLVKGIATDIFYYKILLTVRTELRWRELMTTSNTENIWQTICGHALCVIRYSIVFIESVFLLCLATSLTI